MDDFVQVGLNSAHGVVLKDFVAPAALSVSLRLAARPVRGPRVKQIDRLSDTREVLETRSGGAQAALAFFVKERFIHVLCRQGRHRHRRRKRDRARRR
jgi:hypothetical protein